MPRQFLCHGPAHDIAQGAGEFVAGLLHEGLDQPGESRPDALTHAELEHAIDLALHIEQNTLREFVQYARANPGRPSRGIKSTAKTRVTSWITTTTASASRLRR